MAVPGGCGDRRSGREDRGQVVGAAQAQRQVVAVAEVADGVTPPRRAARPAADMAATAALSSSRARAATGSALASNARWTWVRKPEAQGRIAAVLRHGFQTRDGELALSQGLGDLADR
jgi:hypothetical protein